MKKYLSILLLAGALLGSGCGNEFDGIEGPIAPIGGPVCVDDQYEVNINTPLVVSAANGVLANDTPNGGIALFATVSTNGGSISGNPDGSFTYTPPNGFNGTDTFFYEVVNDRGRVSCKVTITVRDLNGFFVDASAGNDSTGGFTNGRPFRTIGAAVANAPVGATIVVRPGTYNETITLKNGQLLVGSGSVLASAQGAVRPLLSGPVRLADGNTLDFLRLQGSNGDAVVGDGREGGTISRCEIADTLASGDGISLNSARGNWTIFANQFTNLSGGGVVGVLSGAVAPRIQVESNTVLGNDLGAVGFLAEDSSTPALSVVGNTFRGNNLVSGDALEIIVEDSATLCLDLENNIADKDNDPGNADDGVYSFFEDPGPALLQIEQFSEGRLLITQPDGAGNRGVVDDNTTSGGQAPTNVDNGFCGF